MRDYTKELLELQSQTSIKRLMKQAASQTADWLKSCDLLEGSMEWKNGEMKVYSKNHLKIFACSSYDKAAYLVVEDHPQSSQWTLVYEILKDDADPYPFLDSSVFQAREVQGFVFGIDVQRGHSQRKQFSVFNADSPLNQTGFIDDFYRALDLVKLLPLYILEH